VNSNGTANPVRLAIIGAGFWARFQIAAWRELGGVEIVAIYNRTRHKAEALAREFGIPAVYDDAEILIREQQPDALDIITDVDTHLQFVSLAAAHKVVAVCQKPMGATLAQAEHMVRVCAEVGVPLIIHENFRWQTPLRQLKHMLDDGVIGTPFRGRVQFACSFPVFDNQPFLKELDQFIITDIGSHIFDVARFLFGDAQRIYCQTRRVNPTIRGEDVATALLRHGDISCVCDMSYASRLEHERFPETFVMVEGEHGSLELGPDYWIRHTTANGTLARRYAPPRYSWADPAYDLVHSSIVPCNANILRALQGGPPAETRGDDNIQTVRLVFGAYESAQTGNAVEL
jgi:D-apiose dehydrogenase